MPEDSLFQSLYKFLDRFCSNSSIDSWSTPEEPRFALTNLYASHTNLFGILNGFVSSKMSSSCELFNGKTYLIRLLRSTLITSASTLLQVVPSQLLDFFFSQKFVSCSSLHRPKSESRLLHTGRHLHNNQVLYRLIPHPHK